MLVRVGICGVCPTDIKKIVQGTVEGPRIFGHETAGTVVRVGRRVTGFSPGDRVALHHHVPCLNCYECRHRAYAQCATYKKTGVTAGFEPAGGGYAEYVRVLPICLPGIVRIPNRNALEEGAMLEPVNTILKAVNQLPLLAKDCVVVIGQGPIGLLFTRILTLQGYRVIATDLLADRLQRARQFGAWKVANASDPELPDRVSGWTRKRGCDAAIVTVPSDSAVHQAQGWVRNAGSILLFAHTVRGQPTPIDLATICVDEKSFLGSYSSDFTLQDQVADWVFSRKIDVRPLITHRFTLCHAPDAIALAAKPVDGALKVVVDQTLGLPFATVHSQSNPA
jgi:L-iditol 2-dehydrogenase